MVIEEDLVARHCRADACPAMAYLRWVLTAIEGRLRHLRDKCLVHDFDKNQRSKVVHGRTAAYHYQFAMNSAGAICDWGKCSGLAGGCGSIMQELALLIDEMYAKIVAPLDKRVLTDQEAEAYIDQASSGVSDLFPRLQRLHLLAQANSESWQSSLTDRHKQG